METITTLPKISVLLPTYRRPALIGRTLDSIYRQDIPDWELIVIENGSTPEIRQQYEQEVICHFPKNPWAQWITVDWASLPRALNLGLAYASGEYIAVAEDDDEWLPRFLSTLANHMDDCTCGMVYCHQFEVKAGRPARMLNQHPEKFDKNQLLALSYISFPNRLMRRDALESIGGFHPDAGFSTDWITACLISKDWPICQLEETLVVHHWHNDENAPNYCLVEPGWTASSVRYILLQRRMLAEGKFGDLPKEQERNQHKWKKEEKNAYGKRPTMACERPGGTKDRGGLV